MNYSLLIFEWIPESTDFYLIPNDQISLDAREVLTKATGEYVNYGEADNASNLLNNYLETGKIWNPHKKDILKGGLEANITHVYHSGFGT